MATTQLTEQNFEDVVGSNDVVLIDFWAAWCGPCRSFAPTFEKVSASYPDFVFAKVDTEAEQGLAAAFGIMSIPTLMVIRENVVLFNQAGALPEHALVEVVERVRGLDMDEIHREILERRSGPPEFATR